MSVTLVLALLLAGCAGAPAGPHLGGAPSFQQAAAVLEARRLAVRSFSMRGEILMESSEGDISGEHLIQAVYPDRLRVDVVGPFGRPVLRLIVDGPRFSVLVYGENRAYLGNATRQNLARFVGVGLLPSEAYAIISGNLPLVESEGGSVGLADSPGDAFLQIAGRNGRVLQGLYFSLADYAVLRGWVADQVWQRGPGLDCRFGRFIAALGTRYPRLVEVTDASGRRLTLDNDEVVLNPPIDGKLFEEPVPAGLEVTRLP